MRQFNSASLKLGACHSASRLSDMVGNQGATLSPTTSLLLMFLVCGGLIQAQTCPGGSSSVQALQTRVAADQESIKRLGTGLTATDLNDWANAAQAQREQIVKRSMQSAISSLLDYALSAPGNALKPTEIAGYQLPNGIGSIGTGQRNAIVARLRAQGGVEQALIPALDTLSQMSDKRGSLEYMEQLSNVASLLKSTAEMGGAESTIDQTEALFGLVANVAQMAGKEIDLPVAVGNALFNGGSDLFNLFWMSRSVDQLVNTSEAQLNALKALNRQLQNDVQALQLCKDPNKNKPPDAPKTPKPDTNASSRDTQILDPSSGIDDLAKMPMINPDFIAALQCDAAGLRSIMQGGDGGSRVQACPRCRAGDPCNRYADGSYIPAFISPELNGAGDPSTGDLASALDRARQNQNSLNREFQQTQSQANNLQSQIGQTQDQLRSAQQAVLSANQPIASGPAGIPRPRIPAGWIPCTCPDKHPHAGLLVSGARYHSAELRCDRYF